MLLGQTDDSVAVTTQGLEVEEALHVDGAGMTLADSMTRRGRYEEAARLMDEVLPMARGLGGAEFLSVTLVLQARLELARGNMATARQAIAEAAQEVMSTPSASHVFVVLAPAARLLSEARTRELLDRAKSVAMDPAFRAPVREAEAILGSHQDGFADAAELYAS